MDDINLFQMMFEDDPPEVDTEASPPPEQPPANDPPPVDDVPMDTGGGEMPMDNGGAPPTIDEEPYQDGGMMDNSGNNPQEQPDNLDLDEKGEILAKMDLIKEFRNLYQKIDDTISTIDKLDFVQIGNNISSTSIADIKDLLSALMNDVYLTIVYDFQQQYSNLKVKLVEYSSRYVLIVKKLTSLIKKDQKTPRE